ncbi:MAG TPA: PEGA domain-containing protein [Vicinamibacterales bacterium]|nr:PEGA domain-containing protein [Vicinamibacterales bacterium]
MTPSLLHGRRYMPGFGDEFGHRGVAPGSDDAPALEVLEFTPELSGSPDFERALRARIDALRDVHHPSLAAVYGAERPEGSGLCLITEYIPGRRLSTLPVSELNPSIALNLIHTITPVLEELNRTGVGVGHGALSANRIVVTDAGRLVLVEHVLGWAIESLRLSRARLNSLGIVMPNAAGLVRFDGRTDLAQLGFMALSLRLRRPLDPADCPGRVPELLAESAGIDGSTMDGARIGLWLERALQAGPDPFSSVQDAADALAELPGAADAPPGSDAFGEFADEGTAQPRAVPAATLPSGEPEPVAGPGAIPESDRVAKIREAASLSLADLRAALVRPHAPEAAPPPPRRAGRIALWVLGILSVLALGEAAVLVFMASQRGSAAAVQENPAGPDAPDPTPPAGAVATSPASRRTPPSSDPRSSDRSTPASVGRSGHAAASSGPIPTGRISLNATPWAEVTIDGTVVGETPIANLSLPVGPHEIVFRHPEFGVRRQTVIVKPDAVVRVAQAFQ